MLNIYCKVEYRILVIKNYLFFIPLLFMIIGCSAGNNSLVNKSGQQSDNYNLDNLIAHNEFYTPPPANVCRDSIINRDPNLQPPEAKCELDNNSPAQITEGCDVNINQPDSLGAILAKSVVNIASPSIRRNNAWILGCSGTIIGSRWILTAAHCVAFFPNPGDPDYPERGKFKPYIQRLRVVPWQQAYNGVPKRFNQQSAVEMYPAKAIYITAHSAYYGETATQPYRAYAKDDSALIELESSLPDKYQPIAIESSQSGLLVNDRLWMAGYGQTEYNKPGDGQLHYRDTYYFSNRYDTRYVWPSTDAGGPTLYTGEEYGMIYTLDSIIKNLKSYAWSFRGRGDSGGPILYYHHDTKKFSILGIMVRGLYCDYVGFNALLPYAFNQNTEMTGSRYTLVQQIINKTVNPADIRCVSDSDGCYVKTAYVLSKSDNSIKEYRLNQNESVVYINQVTTGSNPRAFTIDYIHNYILGANGGSGDQGSISIFKINPDGSLSANTPAEQQLNGINNPLDIVSDYKNRVESSIYILSNNINGESSQIFKLDLDYTSGHLSLVKSLMIPSPYVNRIELN